MKYINQEDIPTSGRLKERLKFYIGQGICVEKIGLKDLELMKVDLIKIMRFIEIFSDFAPANR